MKNYRRSSEACISLVHCMLKAGDYQSPACFVEHSLIVILNKTMYL